MEALNELARYFPEVAEAQRMKLIYDGLKSGAATRPRYVFQGKDRDWYRKNHPNKATKSIFVMTPLGLRYMPIIMGGSPGTYYLREGGSAANKEAAGGPGSTASACMSVSVHNGETFAAGDVIALADDGGNIRGGILPPTSGILGSPITYQAESGDSPVVDASELVTTWGDEGGNVWSASFTPNGPGQTDVFMVYFDGTLGTDAGSQGAVDAANEWHYNDGTNTLYVYSTSDPDTAFTSPGIEAASDDFCFLISSDDFITIDGIDCTRGNQDCIKSEVTSDGTVIKNLTLSFAFNQGFLSAGSATNVQMSNVISENNGIDSQDHGIYIGSDTVGLGPFLIEDCIARTNAGFGFHCYNGTGGTVRRSLAHDNSDGSGMIAQQVRSDENITYEYCISHSNAANGFSIEDLGAGGQNGNNTVKLYNCVSHNNTKYGIRMSGNSDADATIEVKNCIALENGQGDQSFWGELFHDSQSATFNLDYNCYYRAANKMIEWETSDYTQAQFASYQSASGQDANSISADPLFLDAAGNDYHLKSNSPCIDAGIDVGLNRDYDGITVPQGSAPDMGAYEFEQEAPSPSPSSVVILGASSTPLMSLGENTEIDEFWEEYFQDIERAQNG